MDIRIGIKFIVRACLLLSLALPHLAIAQDTDEDGLEDAWEIKWFGDIELYGAADDPDQDGLSNEMEYSIDSVDMNPGHWDTDGDGFDDQWEYIYSLYDKSHLDPTAPSPRDADYDGDGLSTWQEYCGVDGKPAMVHSGSAAGNVTTGKPNGAQDALNPLDIDTDFDMLIDSFEAAWYDPANDIDPAQGVTDEIPESNNAVDTSLARADSDADGLTNYREQCLLAEFRETGPNSSLWVWEERVPFPFSTYNVELDNSIITVRVSLMSFSGSNLNLGLNAGMTIPANRIELRNEEWTDPTEGTGYIYTDEDIPPGHDTDDDMLPDGWEVEFGLDPRDDGLSGISLINGPFGDPDGDGIWNINEYLGQDGERFATKPYINGTGDETNPNTHAWRADSTYQWRWLPEMAPIYHLTDARTGTGISRIESLGNALPSALLTSGVNTYTQNGYDTGTDSDDDGLTDSEEINMALTDGRSSSPVHSCDPFIPKAALITDPAGIPIPDPEPSTGAGWRPAGLREDLQGRDWTVECYVKLLDDDLSGDIFNFTTSVGDENRIIYRLSLSNNVPVLVAHNNNNNALITMAANEIPTNQWVHLAGVWDHANNNLSLYLHGILQQGQNAMGESPSTLYSPATNSLALAVSPDGSFVDNLLLDEVRIWGVARSSELINQYSRHLAPQNTGDDVWLDNNCPQYYGFDDDILVNGGSLFEGEPGEPLENVYTYEDNYWIDNGDEQYNKANDILLKMDWDTLVEGAPGTLASNVRYNDKDGSGDFSSRSLLAYYRFDDGGRTAEDFARKAKSGLVGSTSENYSFGDHGYALTTNNFQWSTNDYAPVLGTDLRGADDSDNDGMPDAWEMTCHLNAYDDGTGNESQEGLKDGPYGPLGDPDGDGLVNIYEFYSRTNPQEFDTGGQGVPDTQQDLDGDGVVNITEQLLGSRPDIVDTDDDGLTDSEEQGRGSNPANATSPSRSRSIALGGSSDDYAEIPATTDQRLTDWTLEAWVNPSAVPAQDQIVMRRVVQNLAGGTNAINYVMGLRAEAGGLAFYAGYVGIDGTEYTVDSGTIATGEWTHVAASYENLSATLATYTNGVQASSTNNFYRAPPVNGKGGETFLRVGENFDGMIDEVRIWDYSRSETEISAVYEESIANEDGLLHNFRFDDTQADADQIPLGEFNTPQGAQDFTYDADWQEQWIHAARIHGAASFSTNSPIVPPASLYVVLQPEEAATAGAQWSLDGGPWNDSGHTVFGISNGVHAIAYKSLTGWTVPDQETVTISNSTDTVIKRTLIRNGSLKVNLDPIDAIADGSAWRIDSGDWLQSEQTVSNLPPATYNIEYQSIAGWQVPSDSVVTIEKDQTLEITRIYTPIEGRIQVVLTPQEIADAGVQWRVDNRAWRSSGEVSDPLRYGSHSVEFEDYPPWNSPDSQTVDIISVDTTTVTGNYTQTTGLYVEFAPSFLSNSGAVWRVAGGTWQPNETLLQLAPGEYTVEFETVEGWTEPAARTAVVSNELTTSIMASYFQIDMIGSEGTAGPGLLKNPRGMDFDSAEKLYLADTDNHCVQIYDPATDTWETPIGSYGTGAGQFNQPTDVFLDASDNLYVADAKNDRIQMRDSATGTWTARDGTESGTGAGELSGPHGIAVDGAGNIYVADLHNNRVQKRLVDGSWQTIIPTGSEDWQTRFPRDVGILPNGNLLLADYNSVDSIARLREFTLAGDYIQTIGSSEAANGGISKIGNAAVNGDNEIFVADMTASKIDRRDPSDNRWETLFAAGILDSPQGIAFSDTHGLFVADTSNHRIVRIDLNQTTVASAPIATPLAIKTVLAPVAEPSDPDMAMAPVAGSASHAIEIMWMSQSNRVYTIQERSGCQDTWITSPGAGAVTGQGGTTSFIDSNNDSKVKIYRIINK